MDWSIQEIAKIAGTTSRTLRHYDDIGLLNPSRTGHNGYRYYDPLPSCSCSASCCCASWDLAFPRSPRCSATRRMP